MSVVIETTLGDVTVDLFLEERPIACLNFIKLCKLKYYNFNLFHTVEQGFIAQSGDPTGAGEGGSSVWGLVEGLQKRFFEAESVPKIKHTSPGLLSLVSVGNHLVGSQFFLTLGSDLTSLDGIHCVIGEVVEGQETLRKLNDAIVDANFRPFQDIRITHTVILNDPFPDPRGFREPSRSPSPSAERMQNGRIDADEDIDDTGGKSMEEIQEMLAEREAKARATILEIVGDLPDAEMAPPENVLFVCKLNPVTTDDDLEIIFSRFGIVKNCEVIRDKKSGDSLQYAFVEFEEQKSCETAYFKMDNVLIDDRRIHVDFSQSVAKVKWRGKGRGVEGQEGRLDFNNLKDSANKGRQRDYLDKRRDRSPGRMTSVERIKARENRHRERKNEELKERHNRSRSREHRNDSRHKRPDSRERNNQIRSREHEYRNRERDERSREHTYRQRGQKDRDESHTKASDKRYSHEVQCYDRQMPNRRRTTERGREYNTDHRTRRVTPVTDQTRTYKNKADKKCKTKKKRSKSEQSSSTSQTSTSEDSSDSDSSSSSEDKRKKKRKHKSKKKSSKSKKSKKPKK